MGTTTKPPGRFDIDALARQIGALATTVDFGPDQVADILMAALDKSGIWLTDRLQTRDPRQDWVLHPIYRAPDRRVSMLVAVFASGVVSPVHDHGAWAVVGTYRGRERETRYRRVDVGSAPGRARLEVDRTFVNPGGAVSIVPADAIHSVEALDGRDAVSIHVYGTDIVTQDRSAYDLRVGTESAYRPKFTNG